ncbi:MAG: ADOP family duplicated permease, partial [Gemmatimonadaceae bacterium]
MKRDEPHRDGQRLVRPPLDREIDRELAFHIEMRARALAAAGASAAEAERRAVAELGDIGAVANECRTINRRRERQMNRVYAMNELGQDVRFALRLLRRRPGLSALATTTIALGIGAATSIFSVVDGVLLRPLPFANPDRLVAVWIAQPSLAKDPVVARLAERTVLGAEEVGSLRDRTTALSSIGYWADGGGMLVTGQSTEQVSVVQASASLLDVLGERTILGRGLRPEENVLNGPRVALVSWETWTSRFGADSALIGRHVRLDDVDYTIVGVLPRGLRLDRAVAPAAFWTPAMQGKYEQPEYHNRSYHVVGRLRPGVSADAAQMEAARAFRSVTGDSSLSARVLDWQYDQTRESRGPLYLLLGASALLLLIACVNVAMLLLGESASREREVAARVALGASRGRIIRQLLAESMTIAMLGATLGAGLAWALTHTLTALAPSRIAGIESLAVDLRALGFATLCAGIAGVLFGLTPALSLVTSSEGALLRVGTGQSARHGRRAQRWFVATEVALSFTLLFGAVLFARSLQRLASVDPGFRAAQLVEVKTAAPTSFYRDDPRKLAFYEEGVRRLASLAGVDAATAGEHPPFGGGSSSSPVTVEGRTYEHNSGPSTDQRAVFADYFAVLGIPVRQGRAFTPADVAGAELVAIVSEAAARRDFPNEPAVGRRVRWQGQYRRIVGVVGDVYAARLTRTSGPAIYVPMRQYAGGSATFIVRTRLDLSVLAPGIRATLGEIDPAVTVSSVERLPTLIAQSYSEERYRAIIVGTFALFAALLATVGLYGVTLRAAARRTREIGIR